jgi:hypothetical protein
MRSLIVAFLLAVAACGGGGDDDGGGGDDDAVTPDASDEDLGSCGGFAGLQCENEAATYCDWEEDNCGSNDTLGTCRPRPDSCGIAVEVCGCDGVTYQGECEAARAGTDIVHAGACS